MGGLQYVRADVVGAVSYDDNQLAKPLQTCACGHQGFRNSATCFGCRMAESTGLEPVSLIGQSLSGRPPHPAGCSPLVRAVGVEPTLDRF